MLTDAVSQNGRYFSLLQFTLIFRWIWCIQPKNDIRMFSRWWNVRSFQESMTTSATSSDQIVNVTHSSVSSSTLKPTSTPSSSNPSSSPISILPTEQPPNLEGRNAETSTTTDKGNSSNTETQNTEIVHPGTALTTDTVCDVYLVYSWTNEILFGSIWVTGQEYKTIIFEEISIFNCHSSNNFYNLFLSILCRVFSIVDKVCSLERGVSVNV